MQQYYSSNNPNPINNNSSIFYPENDITNINSFSKLDDYNNNIDYDDVDPACSSNNFLHFNNFPNSPQMLESYESVYLQFYDLFHQQSENTPNMVITSSDLNHENAAVLVQPVDHELDAKKLKTTKGRCSKKDRHSKIITASGPRDRRMRLSLDVARKFFQLQDILGYDKASRTVDWLLNSSREAIKELVKSRDGWSRSTSSSITESICDQDQVVSSEKKKTKNKKKKLVAGGGVRGIVGKESRQKARERARERTSQKKRLHMMTKNSTSTTNFNEEGIVDDHVVTRGDENNSTTTTTTTTLLFCTAGGPGPGPGPGPWNINASTTVFGYQEENAIASWNL